ncbi:sigma-70 family RNA polymerase sigma factor [Peptostreptococcus faecalis]|uniref:sigma-70 family RNA polymerase sigma factor n=1 Tax=Peptostreptococcus faecalis TaxID=2045015 RepID=UPI000C7DE627|nr:sigma-70 family RNA polymerase sigma factor [Peptostreptococcus faecalis]
MNDSDILKYERMIYKIIGRYKSRHLDRDDLYQEGVIGVIYAYNNFDETKGMKFDNWVYSYINWHVLRMLRNARVKNESKTISISTSIGDTEDLTYEDTIADESVNIENTVGERLIEQFYLREFERLLDGYERDLIHYMYSNKVFNMVILAEIFNMDHEKVRRHLRNAYRTLRMKSKYIRERYAEIKKVYRPSDMYKCSADKVALDKVYDDLMLDWAKIQNK